MSTIGSSIPPPAATTPDDGGEHTGSAARIPWVEIAWFGALFVILFGTVWLSMMKDWREDESMGHGFFVPLIAGWLTYQNRDEIFGKAINPSLWGLVPVMIGFVLMIVGILGADFFIPRVGLMASLCGIIWTLGGTWTLRRLWFPLFILLFMIRIPLFIYSQVTFKLQLLASMMAEASLGLVGIPVLRDGNILELPSQKLNVVEACSGIRSLMTLSLLSLIYGYYMDEKKWMRWVLFVLSIPLAIVANASRITITGILCEFRKDLAEGFYHSLEGYVIFLVTIVGLVTVHQLVNRFYHHYQTPGAGSAA